MGLRIRGAGPGRRVGRLSSPIFADPIPQLALLIRRKNIGELVLKIDHVLCDHHERVIRRCEHENKKSRLCWRATWSAYRASKCFVPTLRDIKPEADCKREPVGSKQAELFLKHDLVMFYKQHQRQNPGRGGKNALWSTA